MKTLSDYTEEDNKLPPNHFPSQPAMVRFLNDLAQQVSDLQEEAKARHESLAIEHQMSSGCRCKVCITE